MKKIIKINNTKSKVPDTVESISDADTVFNDTIEHMLLEARTKIDTNKAMNVPIAELALLGSGISSLIPALRTVTQTTTIHAQGLYQLANAGTGDVLKVAKNGNKWAAYKTIEGKSKMVQLKEAGPLSASSSIVMPVDPATIMMAVALFAIEQQLKTIESIQKEMLMMMEIEKESRIEADLETMNSIINRYKYNWDNDKFIRSNYKMVADLQRDARANMNSYKKKVKELLEEKHLLVAHAQVDLIMKKLQKKFQYYRLSLYTSGMAAMTEVILGENFAEENISMVKTELERHSLEYRKLFTDCSVFLDKMSGASVDTKVFRGVGTASTAAGKLIGSIPVIKKGPVDEFLQDRGGHIQKSVKCKREDILSTFATLSNPGTGIFIDKLQDMTQIYNHTNQICMDDKKIYLIAG